MSGITAIEERQNRKSAISGRLDRQSAMEQTDAEFCLVGPLIDDSTSPGTLLASKAESTEPVARRNQMFGVRFGWHERLARIAAVCLFALSTALWLPPLTRRGGAIAWFSFVATAIMTLICWRRAYSSFPIGNR